MITHTFTALTLFVGSLAAAPVIAVAQTDACAFPQSAQLVPLGRQVSITFSKKDCPLQDSSDGPLYRKLVQFDVPDPTPILVNANAKGKTGQIDFKLLLPSGETVASSGYINAWVLPAGKYLLLFTGTKDAKYDLLVGAPTADETIGSIDCAPSAAQRIQLGETKTAVFTAGCHRSGAEVVDLLRFDVATPQKIAISVAGGCCENTAELLSWSPSQTPANLADIVTRRVEPTSLGKATAGSPLILDLTPGAYYVAAGCGHRQMYLCVGRYAVRVAAAGEAPVSIELSPSVSGFEAAAGAFNSFFAAWQSSGFTAFLRHYGTIDGPVNNEWLEASINRVSSRKDYLARLLQGWQGVEVAHAAPIATSLHPRVLLTVVVRKNDGSSATHPVVMIQSRNGQWLIENLQQARKP